MLNHFIIMEASAVRQFSLSIDDGDIFGSGIIVVALKYGDTVSTSLLERCY